MQFLFIFRAPDVYQISTNFYYMLFSSYFLSFFLFIFLFLYSWHFFCIILIQLVIYIFTIGCLSIFHRYFWKVLSKLICKRLYAYGSYFTFWVILYHVFLWILMNFSVMHIIFLFVYLYYDNKFFLFI